MLSVTERAVYGASMSSVPQLSLNSEIVGLLTLKRPEGSAPTSRQFVDALLELSLPFRPASRRTERAGRLCYSQNTSLHAPSNQGAVAFPPSCLA